MKNSSDLIAEIKNNAEARGYKVQHSPEGDLTPEEITVTVGKDAWVGMTCYLVGDFQIYDISCNYVQDIQIVGSSNALILFDALLLAVATGGRVNATV